MIPCAVRTLPLAAPALGNVPEPGVFLTAWRSLLFAVKVFFAHAVEA